jgi:ribonuclease HII
MEIYIGAHGITKIAGNVFISAVYFNLDHDDFNNPTKSVSQRIKDCWWENNKKVTSAMFWNNIAYLINNLIERKAITVRISEIPRIEINKFPYAKLYRDEADKQATLLCFYLGVSLSPTLVYSDPVANKAGIKYQMRKQKYGIDIYTYITYANAYISFKRQIQKQHNKYPNYHWSRNVGNPTKEHKTAIIRYGPVAHLHQETAILNSAKFLYDQVKQKTWAVEDLVDYLITPPDWWNKLYPSKNFYDSLSYFEQKCKKELVKEYKLKLKMV